MTGEWSPDVTRRSVLRNLGGSAGAVALGGGVAAAQEEEDDDVEALSREKVTETLEAAGDPEVTSVSVQTLDKDGEVEIDITRIETATGTLKYAEADREIMGGGRSIALYLFDEITGKNKKQVPRRFRNIPPDTGLALVHDGSVDARRDASKPERKALEDILDVDLDDSEAILGEAMNGFSVVDHDDEGVRADVIIEDTDVSVGEQLVGALRRGDYTVEKREVSTQGHCWNLTGPCTSCVWGTGVCSGCSYICVQTGGWGCYLCIADCAYTGTICGCCLNCLDSWPPHC